MKGVIAAVALLIAGCAGSPAPVDTTQVLSYGSGLANCEAQEALFDGGPEASMAFYVECKHKLGVDAGGL